MKKQERKTAVIYVDNMEEITDKDEKGLWQRTYTKDMAEYINCLDLPVTRILAHIIQEKDKHNKIYTTVKELAEDLKVSPRTVANVFKTLQEKNMLRRVRNGCYMINMYISGSGMKVSSEATKLMWSRLK